MGMGAGRKGDAMNAKEAQVLIDTIKGLVEGQAREVVATGPTGNRLVKTHETIGGFSQANGQNKPVVGSRLEPDAEEKLYQKFKARLIDEARIDPILLQILTQRPEIIVEVEPRIVTLDGGTLKGRIARLMASGFFSDAKTQGACRAELRRTGTDPNSGQIGVLFSEFVKDGFFTREGEAYKLAPGVKVTQKELQAV